MLCPRSCPLSFGASSFVPRVAKGTVAAWLRLATLGLPRRSLVLVSPGSLALQHLDLSLTPLSAVRRISSTSLRVDLVLELAQRVRNPLAGDLESADEGGGVAGIAMGREEGVHMGVTVCPLVQPIQVQLERHWEVKVDQNSGRLAQLDIAAGSDLAHHHHDCDVARLEAAGIFSPLRLRMPDFQGASPDVLKAIVDQSDDPLHARRVRNHYKLLLLKDVVELDEPLESLQLCIFFSNHLQVVLDLLKDGQQLRGKPPSLGTRPVGGPCRARARAKFGGILTEIGDFLMPWLKHAGFQLALFLLPLSHAQVQDVADQTADPKRKVHGVHRQLLQLTKDILDH
mmetsp:Transcript_80908/g.203547  ORF Transcript_80908/g.203547 Transcript_80908/m.203547 type:complete len:342 (+) Transcript_80908:662-1687(+)